MKKQSDYYLPAIILLGSLMVIAAVFGEWQSPFRGIVVFGFMLICPGLAFAHLLPGKDQITRFILVIVLSLAIDTAIVEVILYLGIWSPRLILLILIGFCCLGILLKLLAENIHHKSAHVP